MSRILIVYASVGGNTKLVVDSLVDNIFAQNPEIIVECKRAELTTAEDLSSQNLIILASPTYGQGTLETQMSKFLKVLKPFVSTQKFAVIGLGDMQYYPEYLSEASGILVDFIIENKGIIVTNTLKIGAKPLPYIPKLVPRFAKSIVDNL